MIKHVDPLRRKTASKDRRGQAWVPGPLASMADLICQPSCKIRMSRPNKGRACYIQLCFCFGGRWTDFLESGASMATSEVYQTSPHWPGASGGPDPIVGASHAQEVGGNIRQEPKPGTQNSSLAAYCLSQLTDTGLPWKPARPGMRCGKAR